ncbi:unnamed protein product [Phytomonas sp. Hart1]|nr:unnamed protein product [Phytomonas sp. Hart1]|eukprot:CCW68066.1 unnamed protein product [Phytomonas sp. isolate Hart1]
MAGEQNHRPPFHVNGEFKGVVPGENQLFVVRGDVDRDLEGLRGHRGEGLGAHRVDGDGQVRQLLAVQHDEKGLRAGVGDADFGRSDVIAGHVAEIEQIGREHVFCGAVHRGRAPPHRPTERGAGRARLFPAFLRIGARNGEGLEQGLGAAREGVGGVVRPDLRVSLGDEGRAKGQPLRLEGRAIQKRRRRRQRGDQAGGVEGGRPALRLHRGVNHAEVAVDLRIKRRRGSTDLDARVDAGDGDAVEEALPRDGHALRVKVADRDENVLGDLVRDAGGEGHR